jgi:hypothetical protein
MVAKRTSRDGARRSSGITAEQDRNEYDSQERVSKASR